MQKDKISLIIPVHNSSLTLEKCVDSVLKQTYKNLEIFLINNGSNDNSLEICMQIAAKDSRVRVVHINEGNVSKARNIALDEMTGDYFAFIDSDDFVDETMYEKLCEKAKLEQADMVFCNFNIVENGTDIKPYDEEKLKDMIYNKQFQLIFKSGKEYVKANIWRTLFKSDTFKSIRFDDRLYFGEDFVYMFKIFQTSCNMVLLDEYLYYYSLVPITMSKKYFNSKMLQNDKLYAKYAYEFLDNFNMHDYAVAAKYGSWIHLVHSILAYSSNYREEIELVMNDEFWQEVATKQNYKIFVKRLCANFKFKLRAFLLQHRKFSTYRYLVKKFLNKLY